MEPLGKKRKKGKECTTRIGTRRKGKSILLDPQGIIILLYIIIYMTVGVMRILVLIKFLKFVIFFFVKIGDPYPMCVLSTLESTYVKICRDCQHMSKYVYMLPFPNIWTHLG